MATEIDNPAHIVLSIVTKTVDEWKEKNPPEQIKKDTLKLLNKNAEEILFKLLGFNKDDWGRGKFHIDHCNGRSGESAVGDYIRKHQQETIEEWLRQAPLPELSAALRKEITAEAEHRYRQAFREHFYQRVEDRAKEEADEAFEQISATLALDKYTKTINLLTDNGTAS